MGGNGNCEHMELQTWQIYTGRTEPGEVWETKGTSQLYAMETKPTERKMNDLTIKMLALIKQTQPSTNPGTRWVLAIL